MDFFWAKPEVTFTLKVIPLHFYITFIVWRLLDFVGYNISLGYYRQLNLIIKNRMAKKDRLLNWIGVGA